MISSTGNGKIKQTAALVKKSKARREQNVFVVEGVRMFAELPKERIVSVFVSESFMRAEEHKTLVKDVPWELVSDEVFHFLSDTQSPQGILAVARQYHYELGDLLKTPQKAMVMILETLQDPGNLGTIIRAGEGAGVTGVLMDLSTADIYNPKVIRSTMGSIFRIPFVYTENLQDSMSLLKQKGIRLYAAHLNGNIFYDKEDYRSGTGFLIGNEAAGLSGDATSMADTLIKIPMLGKVESLNAATAASLLMFEASRQRRG